jgi:predicted XRE-type DNA-binding protein
MARKATDDRVITGSGNVFSDLGLPRAEEAFAKAELARHIGEIITKKGLTQAETAKVLGIDQPKVSALLRGRLTGFSTERLIRFATALGRDVEIAIRPKPKNHKRGEIRVLKKASAGVR